MGKCRRVRAKLPFSFLSPTTKNRGEEEGEKGPGGARSRSPSPISEEGPRREGCGGCGRGGRAAAAGCAGGGSSERALVGEREREERGLHPPAHLGRRWLEEVARLGPVEGGGHECGGDAASRGVGDAVAAWLVVAVVELGGLFIAEERRWSGGAPVVAGRRPLMALRASRSGVTRDSHRRCNISGSGTVCRRKASTWRAPRGTMLVAERLER